MIWKRIQVPLNWKRVHGVWVLKEENFKTFNQLRIFSLLDVESKFFCSILAKQLRTFLKINRYIDTSIQKGGISGIAGCIEHTNVITQLLKETKENAGSLVTPQNNKGRDTQSTRPR